MSPLFPLRRPRIGLLAQIGLALALVGTVPLAMTAIQLAQVNREALVEQLLRTHTVSARTAADAIDGFLAARRSLAETLLLAPELVDEPTSEQAQNRLRDSLTSWSTTGVIAAALFDPTDKWIVRVQQKGYAYLADGLLGWSPRGPSSLQTIDLHPWIRLELPLGGDPTATASSTSGASAGSVGSLRLAIDGAPLLRTLAPVSA